MALVPSAGSFDAISKQKAEPQIAPVKVSTFIEGGNFQVPSDGTLSDEKLVKDVFLTQTAWNVERWPDGIGLLAGYSDGIPKAVTYFNIDQEPKDFRNNPTDIPLGTEHIVHKNLIKIINFELRFVAGFDYANEKAENRMTANNVCFTPPGFKPQLGDFFYLMFQDGKTGLVVVRDIERLSISQATLFKCDVELVSFLTKELRDYYDSCVVDTRYFDKVKYLTSNMTLLSTKSYNQLNTINQYRNKFITYYYDTFYDDSVSSVMRPDGLYDPYVVEFLHKKISVKDSPIRPMQLLPDVNDYHRTVWSCFTDRSRDRDPLNCIYSLKKVFRNNTYWNASITPLINRWYLALGSPSLNRPQTEIKIDELYIFSENFYSGNRSGMTPIECMFYDTLCNQSSVDTYLEFMGNYRNWELSLAFYYIPLCIWLVDYSYSIVTD